MAGATVPSADRSQDGAPRPSREQRAASGKAARVPELLPILYGRMLFSPFAFYRGAALVMAADLDTTPTSGLHAQLCGDAHLSNFGAYASPERRLVFDLNDFDETLPGPFEWDVKRLAANLVVAGRDNGFTAKQNRKTTLAAVGAYRTAMRTFATQPILDVWYAHLNIDDVLTEYETTPTSHKSKQRKTELEAAETVLAKAHTRDRLQAIAKLTTVIDRTRRIISDPPLIVPIDELTGFDPDLLLDRLRDLVTTYRDTLQTDRRHLLDHFTLTDVAHKVVEVGSVGTRAWILLLEAGVDAEALLLQAKQADKSVLTAYAGESEYTNQGERVVTGQRRCRPPATSSSAGCARSPPAAGTRTTTSASLSGEEFTVRVAPKQSDEFTCTSCFLVHHHSRLADDARLIRRDCAFREHRHFHVGHQHARSPDHRRGGSQHSLRGSGRSGACPTNGRRRSRYCPAVHSEPEGTLIGQRPLRRRSLATDTR
ncbi:DUF4193 family protein [Rhodococcus jostii]